MSREVLRKKLAGKSRSDIEVMKFVIATAPVLKRLRGSCVMIIRIYELRTMIGEIVKAGLNLFILDKQGDNVVTLVFRKNEMMAHLQNNEVREFLEMCGYSYAESYEAMCIFRENMKAYYHEDGRFPHEMGVFLQYPISDVKAYVRNEGQNFIICGYWKVYNNAGEAKRLFAQIDKAKSDAMDEWFEGKNISEIAV